MQLPFMAALHVEVGKKSVCASLTIKQPPLACVAKRREKIRTSAGRPVQRQ